MKEVLIIALISFMTFHQVIFNEFTFDDLPAIVNNDLNLKAIFTSKDFWGDELKSPKSHKSYRPLTSLTFILLQKKSFSIHLFNLIIHTINSILVFFICNKKVFNDKMMAFITALIFNLHPVHVEPVASAVGSADLLYSFIILLALYQDWNHPILASICLLFKEQGIVFMAMIKMYSMKTFFVTFGLFILRLSIIGFEAPKFQIEDNPHSKIDDFQLRIFNRLYIYWLNFKMILNPDQLCFDWALRCVPIINFNDVNQLTCIILSLMMLSGLILKCYKQQYLMWTVLPFIPCANIFFDVGFVLAERNLYLVIFGFSILISIGFQKINKFRKLMNFLLIITLTAFALKSFTRTLDWRNEKSLYLSGLKVCPTNAKVHYNVAKVLNEEGNVDHSILFYQQALNLHPKYEAALNNLANIYRQKGEYSKAEILLQKAVKINEEFSTAWMNLGVVQAEMDLFQKAESSYLKAKLLRKSYPDVDFNLGNLYLKFGFKSQALKSFIEAVESDFKHKNAWINAIMLSDELGKTDLAINLAEKAIKLNPESKSELNFHLGNIFGKMNDFVKAENHYKMAQDFSDSGLYYGNLGVLYHRWKKYDLAKEHYEKALQFDNNEHLFQNLKIVDRFLQNL